jgi:hypothetical protein
MHEQIIEASECLKNLWDHGLIVQQPYTPEDNGSDDCQAKDENGSIVGLPEILFRLCRNNIRLHVIGTGRRRCDAEITLAPVTQDGVPELKPAFAVYVSNYLGLG